MICKGECGRDLPHTEEYFYSYRSSSGKRLLRTTCKECVNKKNIETKRKKAHNKYGLNVEFYNSSSFRY